MRFIGKAVSVLLVAATIVSLAPGLLWAGAETGGGSIFDSVVNPNAPGTKVSGPMTIFYDVVEITPTEACPSGQLMTGISVVMALTKGNTVNTFSNDFGISPALCFPAIDTQVALVTQFIQDRVIPILFPGITPTPSFQYKSATAPNPTKTGTSDSFAVSLNVILAVQ